MDKQFVIRLANAAAFGALAGLVIRRAVREIIRQELEKRNAS